MEVEKIVAIDRASRYEKAQRWKTLTKYATKCLRKAMDNARLLNCQAISQSDYIVVAQSQQGKRQLQVALGNGMSCSCGRPAKYLLPCAHVVSAAQMRNQQCNIMSLFCPTWTKEIYLQAYAELELPHRLVNREELLPNGIEPPLLGRRRGRPRKRRIESQIATQELEVVINRKYRCGICREFGHTKPRCPRTEQ